MPITTYEARLGEDRDRTPCVLPRIHLPDQEGEGKVRIIGGKELELIDQVVTEFL